MNREAIDVFVIEDDADLCVMMKSMLLFANYRVETITNPSLLQSKLQLYHPRMILTDMLLSGSDGRDICKMLKADDSFSELKIMMISAHPDAEISCRAAGADDFLGKPFDMDIFLQKIAEVLKQ